MAKKRWGRSRPRMFPTTILLVCDDYSQPACKIAYRSLKNAGFPVMLRNVRNGHNPDLYGTVVYLGVDQESDDDHIFWYNYTPYYKYIKTASKPMAAEEYYTKRGKKIASLVLSKLKK